MTIFAGVVFKKDENGESIGYMRNALDKGLGGEHLITRYEDKPLESRYYLDSNNLKISLGDYLSERSLRRIENYYQNHRSGNVIEDNIYQMSIRLLNFDAMANQINF